ncbi:protein tyrosine kinase [Ancylostoma ceylanicum]|uniref:receptor protein-tyrosine kinase n=1 Tax=Ancylostoma ceylanicum TaxID=53326 RepID=A0A0D6LED9_9BILA|nr:protein tyrosine kinase [Ancylostoma ceylanicum]
MFKRTKIVKKVGTQEDEESKLFPTDGSDPTPTWAPSDSCTDDAFANIKVPPVLNTSDGTYVQHDCGIAVLLDLDRTYTSEEGFSNVRLFIRDTIGACMSRGIGYRTYIYPMFNSSIQTVCCAEDVCSQQIELMDYSEYVVNYDTLAPVQNETEEANFTYALVDLMKLLAQPKTKCLYNTIVLLTNRIFVTNQTLLGKDVANIVNYGCITFTIIALGNTGITQEMMFQYYSVYTQRLFVVPGYNCITKLDTSPDPSLSDYWHIIYLFALSNRTTNDQFQRAVKFISTPLQQCANFVSAYNDVNGALLKHLQPYYFEIIAFNALAAEVYQNQTTIPKSHIISDPNYGDSPKDMVDICPTKKTSVPTIMIVIIGTCAGAVLILIVATILYRQKYMWMEKLNRFRTRHEDDGDADDDAIIDYWELSPEKVIVKNEQLGHGAYGQSRSVDTQIECTKEFLNFAWQIAKGMSFLGQKNIIHRDLAARNILISDTDGMKSAKISDFGLSLSTEDSSQLPTRGRLPIKWLALECLQREVFSIKSDVWSYGIVLFEMYSMGERPFEDIEPLNLIAHLEAGNRPKRPLLACDKIAEVMTRCWDKVPDKRPTFEELLVIFATLLEQSTEGYGYLALIKTAETYIALTELSPLSRREARPKRATTFTTPASSIDSVADSDVDDADNNSELSVPP